MSNGAASDRGSSRQRAPGAERINTGSSSSKHHQGRFLCARAFSLQIDPLRETLRSYPQPILYGGVSPKNQIAELYDQMMLLQKIPQQLCSLKKCPWSCDSRYFWGWLNAVFNKVDHDRIKDVGPNRAASEWLLRCGATVRYHGQERWQKDYNNLPTGPLDKYKIQAIDATDSCIMNIGFDHLEGLEHVEKIRLCKCHYIEDDCLKRLSQLEKLQKSLLEMEIISCGNVTDKGIIALCHLRNLKYLLLSDLPGVREKENLVQAFKTALPSLQLELHLK